MFGKISRVLVVVLALLALVGTVSAQINNPVNSFLGGGPILPPANVCDGSGAKEGDLVEFWDQGSSSLVQAVITYVDGAYQLFGAVGGYLNRSCSDITQII